MGTVPTAPQSLQSMKKDRKSTRLNSSHGYISYAVFCLKKKKEPDSKFCGVLIYDRVDISEIIIRSISRLLILPTAVYAPAFSPSRHLPYFYSPYHHVPR